MLKLLLCIVIVVSSSVLGCHYSNKLLIRKSVLQKFIKELKSSVTQIRYTSATLCEIFSDKFSDFHFTSDDVFATQWKTLVHSYEKSLDKSDVKLLISFAENLGTTDVDGEISHIEMYIDLLNSSVQDAQNNINQKSKLYRTLGLSSGILVSILLL